MRPAEPTAKSRRVYSAEVRMVRMPSPSSPTRYFDLKKSKPVRL